MGEAAQELADFEVVGGHGADQRHQVLAQMLGDGVLIDLDGQVITALGRIFMQGALQEGQGVLDLALELFLAEAENFMLFARKYAYIYAYFRASKSARQEGNVKNNEKKCPKELNCYLDNSTHSRVSSRVSPRKLVFIHFLLAHVHIYEH